MAVELIHSFGCSLLTNNLRFPLALEKWRAKDCSPSAPPLQRYKVPNFSRR